MTAVLLNWDHLDRFHLGFAVSVKGREEIGAKSASAYLTAGLAF